MSAFLGPIHHWVFNKIKLQNEIVDRLIAFSEQKGWNPQLRNQLARQFGELEQQPLEKIIDGSNIHGWLQERVSLVEDRLAHAVTEILKDHPEALPELEQIFYEVGRQNKPSMVSSPGVIYKHLNDTLLDGMPCDHANDLISENDAEVVWRRNTCVHKQYWDSISADVATYYALREAFVKGMLDESGLILEKSDQSTFTIRR